MTDEQLKYAIKHQEYHREAFGHPQWNTRFLHSRIESLPLESQSVDVIVSNCVLNLCPDKGVVLKVRYIYDDMIYMI